MSVEASEGSTLRFSLVLGTRGRQIEVGALLESLLRQARGDFELIVVDQNQDERLRDILAQYAHRFPLHHIPSDGSGLSRARNVGLAYAKGELIGFPDDDCSYLDGYLDAVDRIFARDQRLGGLTGHPTTEKHLLDENSLGDGQDLGVYTVHNRCQEFIPDPFNQDLCAQLRSPMDMIVQGWSTSLFQAAQQWSTRFS